MRSILAATVFIIPAIAFSYGGGLNAKGCHNDRKQGEYYCHRTTNVPPPSVEAASLKGDRHSITTFSQEKSVLSSAV